jgi:hypothetical protein
MGWVWLTPKNYLNYLLKALILGIKKKKLWASNYVNNYGRNFEAYETVEAGALGR